MTPEQRKDLVTRLLEKGRRKTEEEIQIILNASKPDMEFLYTHIRQYILAKFMLEPDCEEDDLMELSALSLARTMKIDRSLLKSLDTATPCDHATSESAKKVLLLFALQRDLGVKPDPAAMADAKTVRELTELIYKTGYL